MDGEMESTSSLIRVCLMRIAISMWWLSMRRRHRRSSSSGSRLQTEGLTALMALDDPDLLDLLLARREPEAPLDRASVRDVLTLMRV